MQLTKPQPAFDEDFYSRWFQSLWQRDRQSTAVRTITASDTIDSLDSIVRGDATSGSITATLPTIIGQFGRPPIAFKKIDASANTVTVSAANTTFTVEASSDRVFVATNDFDQTGIPVQLTNSGGALPTGLSTSTTYYTVYVSPKTVKLSTSLANAKAGTVVNITGAGTGTQTIWQLMDGSPTKAFTAQGAAFYVIPTEMLTWDIMPVINGQALTRVDDTNVTLTLGGSPTTALLAATSITVSWSGQLAAGRGGTGIATYAVGDLIYASGSTVLSKLADVATGNALISGGVTTAPSWGKVGLTTHVSGTLAHGNGGTDVTAVGSAGQLLRSNGASFALSTTTYPDTVTSGRVLLATGTNVVGNGPAPDADGTYAIDGAAPGTLSSITIEKGLITGHTVR